MTEGLAPTARAQMPSLYPNVRGGPSAIHVTETRTTSSPGSRPMASTRQFLVSAHTITHGVSNVRGEADSVSHHANVNQKPRGGSESGVDNERCETPQRREYRDAGSLGGSTHSGRMENLGIASQALLVHIEKDPMIHRAGRAERGVESENATTEGPPRTQSSGSSQSAVVFSDYTPLGHNLVLVHHRKEQGAEA